jgi:spermidine synthase
LELSTAALPEASSLPRRGFLGVFFVALAILVLEVSLTRVLSVVMWYHYAFVVISLAMLGLAIAGVFLYLVPPLVRHAPSLIPWFCRASGVTTVLALLYLARTPFKTEAATEIFSRDVAIFYVVALLPFLFGGFAISSALTRYARQINTLYFADLVGAGLGCALVVLLLELAGAPAAILVSAAFFMLGAMLLRREGASAKPDLALALAAVGLVAWAWPARNPTGPSTLNDLRHPFEPRYQKGVADWEKTDRVLFLGWNSHSRIKITEPVPPAGHAADVRVIDIDGNANTGVVRIEGQATAETVAQQAPWMKTWIGAAPYAILPPSPKVLIIGPGGGKDVLAGILAHAHVTAVEVNGLIFDLMTKGPFADWAGGVYRAPGVRAVHDEARSWVRRTGERFDLIQATLVDTWAATAAGAFTLAENSLYTVEAFDDFFSHLTDDGIVHITRWHRDPPRESLRAVVLMTEVMKRRSVPSPEKHILVGLDGAGMIDGNQPYAMLFWSRQEFTPERVAKLLEYAGWRKAQDPRLTLEPAYVPGIPSPNAIGSYLKHPDRSRFIDDYQFDVSPTTDDRPFFFNAVRLWDIARFKKETYQNEQAVVVLVTVLGTVLCIVLIAFAVPFALTIPRIRRASGPGTGVSLLYFCGIGVGFMLVEMPLLQRFGLYLGHPTHALSTILATLLTSTGVGSALAGWTFTRHPVRGVRVAIVMLIVGIGALIAVVPQLLASTLAMELWFRVGVTVGLVFPLGILMGFPLPLGIRALGRGRAALIPWAWGMNGATSVLASVLGVAIGIYAGFTVALLAGAAFYGLALYAAARLPGRVLPAPVVVAAPAPPASVEEPPPIPVG